MRRAGAVYRVLTRRPRLRFDRKRQPRERARRVLDWMRSFLPAPSRRPPRTRRSSPLALGGDASFEPKALVWGRLGEAIASRTRQARAPARRPRAL